MNLIDSHTDFQNRGNLTKFLKAKDETEKWKSSEVNEINSHHLLISKHSCLSLIL